MGGKNDNSFELSSLENHPANAPSCRNTRTKAERPTLLLIPSPSTAFPELPIPGAAQEPVGMLRSLLPKELPVGRYSLFSAQNEAKALHQTNT